MKKIAVFFGGESVEHDVSVITGVTTLNSIDTSRYQVIPVYVEGDGKFYTGDCLFDIDGYKTLNTKKLKRVTLLPSDNGLYQIKKAKLKKLCSISAIVNCMHGGVGEDGSMAGLFNVCKIPCTSSGVTASSMSMDKAFTKTVLKGLNVKHLSAVKVNGVYDLHKREKELAEFPVIVKPNLLGSSIGITKAENRSQLINGVLLALKYNDSVIIEPCLENFMEINCAVYRDYSGKLVVSECERPIANSEILGFDDKYKKGEREFPAKIEKRITDKIKKTTQKVYECCNFSGIIRIDYMVKDNQIYLNEINSVPGSLAYYLFSDTLKDFSLILTDLIEKAIKDNEKNKTTVKTFDSGILGGFGIKGAKHL